jgi:3-deoxy-D-manno-octulosonate 8-phosphate phosphatase (KDO 8-P phosphatase)
MPDYDSPIAPDIYERAARIEMVVFDVDGVLTDGRLIYGDDGLEYKAFFSRDGHGMKMLRESGVEIGIITGRTSELVKHRMANLGIQHLHQGQQVKLPAFEKLCADCALTPDQVAYVGDDVVDLPIMLRVGLAIAVQDAHPLVVQHAHWRTPHGGGQGAARDVCELIMDARGTLDAMLAPYFET